MTVFDKETMKADDLVGSVKLKFTDVCVDGQLDKWVKLEHNGKPAGEVHLKGKFTPTVKPLGSLFNTQSNQMTDGTTG